MKFKNDNWFDLNIALKLTKWGYFMSSNVIGVYFIYNL